MIVCQSFKSQITNHQSQIKEALTALRNHGIIAFPTDTVYGFGADAGSDEAVGKLFRLKGRPPDKPVPVMIHRVEDLLLVVRDAPDGARRLMEKHWPGALTIVLPKAPNVSSLVTGGRDTVGVRIPDHPVALELLRKFGKPLAVTSANLSGGEVITEYEDALAAFGDRVEVIIPGEVRLKKISTVVDFTVNPPAILREGAVKLMADGW